MDNKKGLIIIGGGITGLSAGITWAKNVNVKQQPVTIFEKQPVVGGYVTSFKRKGYLFDTTQIIPDVYDILNYFGVSLGLKQFKGFYARIFIVNPETGEKKVIKIPSSLTAFEYWLMNTYPSDAKSIKRFFSYSKAMYDELYHLKYEPKFKDLISTLLHCPKIVLNAHKTFKEYYDSFNIKNPEIREIFNVFAAFSGLPAERCASLLIVSALHTTIEGAYRPVKGFIEFPLMLRKTFEKLGGEVRTNTKVQKILVKEGRIAGIETTNGDFYEAENIITTIDPKVAMQEMVGLDTIKKLDPAYARKVSHIKMSSSSIHISLGLDDEIKLDETGFNCGYNVLTTGKDTFEKLFQCFDNNEIGISDKLFHAGVICPSIATNQKPSLSVRVVPVPMADWSELRENNPEKYEEKKNEIADFVIKKVEEYMIPELSKHIVTRDIATPATFARYSGSPTGSNYDMAPYPDNFGRKRLKMRTPVAGLYQPKFSHGIWPSLQAGLQIVDMILKGKVMNGYSRYRKEFN